MESQSELKSNLETYQAQLKQVEAALMIDEDNDELIKLKGDLEEVINLTCDLLAISTKDAIPKPEKKAFRETDTFDVHTKEKDDTIPEKTSFKTSEKEPVLYDTKEQSSSAENPLKRTADDADIDFEAMFGLPKRGAVVEDELNDSPAGDKDDESTKNKDKNSKLSREEQEKRREQRKKKLLKKKQRLKEIEDQREREKSSWQKFVKGPTKGKGKLKGLIKKSIFASPDANLGKVGVGTCGIGGKGMTDYENPTQFIYKK